MDTRKRETQFGIRSRPNLSGDCVGFRKHGPRVMGRPGEVLRLGSAAEQDPKAHPVGHST